MRNTLLTILFTSFFLQSYSQDFGEIKLDPKLQIKYSDTLQNIGERLTGKWKYLGKRNSGILSDTLFVSFNNKNKTTVIVENGIVFEIENNNRKKADYYYETSYEFKNGSGIYSEDKKYFKENILEISTCQPFPELIFYQNKFGILFIGLGGQNFEAISKLKADKLVFENGSEYWRTE